MGKGYRQLSLSLSFGVQHLAWYSLFLTSFLIIQKLSMAAGDPAGKPEEGWRVKGRHNLSIVRGVFRPCRSLMTLVPCREQLGREYTNGGVLVCAETYHDWWVLSSHEASSWTHNTPTFHRWSYGAWEVKELAQSRLETGDTLKPRTDGPVYSSLYTSHGIILAFLLGWGLGGTK